MDDNQQQVIFNELHAVANKIIGDIEGKLNSTRDDLHGALDELENLRDTNRNLSAELAKSQKACKLFEDEPCKRCRIRCRGHSVKTTTCASSCCRFTDIWRGDSRG